MIPIHAKSLAWQSINAACCPCLFDSKSTASQTTATDNARLLGSKSRYTESGSFQIGDKARYTEAGSLQVGDKSTLNTGTQISGGEGSTITVNSGISDQNLNNILSKSLSPVLELAQGQSKQSDSLLSTLTGLATANQPESLPWYKQPTVLIAMAAILLVAVVIFRKKI